MVSDMGSQCQMAHGNSLVDDKSVLGPSMATVSITFVVIIYALASYTMGLILIGYGCGCRIIKRKSFVEKMTMTPMAYTAVRNVQQPRFDFSTIVDGCW